MRSATKRVLFGVGCGVLLLVLTCGGLAAGAVYLLVTTVEDSPPVQAALAHARADARVAELLGVPLEPTWARRRVRISRDGGATHADIRMQVRGPEGHGDLVAVGRQVRPYGPWTWESFTVESPRGRVDLASPAPPAPVVPPEPAPPAAPEPEPAVREVGG